MENKKDLAKIALTALILASAIPANGQADIGETGTFLVAGCPAHGCPAKNEGNRNQQPVDRSYLSPNDQNGQSTMTEAQLMSMLNPQGRAIYTSLDAEGKGLAIQLASQENYRDKNMAVKEAQKRVNERKNNR